jgi:hypothetical protein
LEGDHPAILYPRWPPLLKIEISSNGQNCSILSENVPKQFWPFEEISIFSNGSHLGWRAGLSDTILKGTHPGTIPARFGLFWFSGFREEDYFLTYIMGFFMNFELLLILTDYAN